MLGDSERRRVADQIKFARQLHANSHADEHRHTRLLSKQAAKTITNSGRILRRERRVERPSIILSAPPTARQRLQQDAVQPRSSKTHEPLSIIEPARLLQRLKGCLKLRLRDVIAGHRARS